MKIIMEIITFFETIFCIGLGMIIFFMVRDKNE
jgi:hypothetical protein